MDNWLKPALNYIPQWLDYQMRESEQPGCVVAIVHKGQVVLERAFGYADIVGRTPLTPRHWFRVASHSKSFTAAGIMKLREAGKAKAVVRIFEPSVRLDHRCRRKVGAQFGRVEEWAPVLPRAVVAAVSDDSGAMREQLRDRCLRDRGMKPIDVPPDAVVETKAACFAKLHDASHRKALRMRGDAKTMARG